MTTKNAGKLDFRKFIGCQKPGKEPETFDQMIRNLLIDDNA